MTHRFTFIGATTGQSSIMRIFPKWKDRLLLGQDVELVGWDIALDAPAQSYRDAVIGIRDDPDNLGAVVTTHKLSLYRAAGDLFDDLDHYARLCEEISCIAKRSGRLRGLAMDPIGCGRALQSMLGSGYFQHTGGEVLCFGAGGAGLALTVYLMTGLEPHHRPKKIVITDVNAGRLSHLRAVHGRLDCEVPVEYVLTAAAADCDRLLAGTPPGSLVVNATGMGKDRPGSPITDGARFPERGIVWELNYRGALDFLHQAWRQRTERKVRVEDGWQLFLIGWTSHIEEVFGCAISPTQLEDLAQDAAFARPQLPTNPTTTS